MAGRRFKMILLQAKTSKALAWINENTDFQRWQILGNQIACESRMGFAIKEAMEEDGLKPGVDFN